MKKSFVFFMLLMVMVGLVAVAPSASWAQGKGPIKIGYITPLSGGMAANGKGHAGGS